MRTQKTLRTLLSLLKYCLFSSFSLYLFVQIIFFPLYLFVNIISLSLSLFVLSIFLHWRSQVWDASNFPYPAELSVAGF